MNALENQTRKQLCDNCRAILQRLECDAPNPDCDDGDILDDALDIEFTINARGQFIGANILMAYGGPGISIDTRHNSVNGSWGGDQVSYIYHDAFDLHVRCEALFEALR